MCLSLCCVTIHFHLSHVTFNLCSGQVRNVNNISTTCRIIGNSERVNKTAIRSLYTGTQYRRLAPKHYCTNQPVPVYDIVVRTTPPVGVHWLPEIVTITKGHPADPFFRQPRRAVDCVLLLMSRCVGNAWDSSNSHMPFELSTKDNGVRIGVSSALWNANDVSIFQGNVLSTRRDSGTSAVHSLEMDFPCALD